MAHVPWLVFPVDRAPMPCARSLSRKYQAAVTGQLGFAIALTCLLVGLKMDGLASHSWFAALCPLLVWLFTGCIYIGQF